MIRKHPPLALLILCLGCAGLVAAQDSGVQTVELRDGSVGTIHWTAAGTIQAPGFGCPTDAEATEAQRAAAARSEATIVARRRLLEVVQGIPLVAGLTTEDAMRTSNSIRSRILGIIQGAAVVAASEVRNGEDCIELVVAVPLAEFRGAVPPDEIAGILAAPAPSPRNPEIEALLDQARDLTSEALRSDLLPSPDQRIWVDALARIDAAHDQAPRDIVVLHTRARIYSYVGWHIRAWEYWHDYFEAGGTLKDPLDFTPPELTSEALFAEVGSELGFARYQAGLDGEALGYYLAVLERRPNDQEALTWAARIYFEQGQTAAALPLWERLATLDPNDQGTLYFLERTRERLAVGPEASDTFQSGLLSYQAGDLDQALTAFEAAFAFNDTFAEAAVWAGRTSLELGQPERSHRHWNRVLQLDPSDGRAAYFLELAGAQAQWGIDAANTFDRGQQLYQQGDLAGAAASFAAATRSNAGYLQAWLWAARTHHELGRLTEAIPYWQAVLERNADDPEAGYYLELAQQQLTYGIDAGRSIAEAKAAFEVADFETAEVRFRDAIDIDPELAEAWGWLGRIYFARGDYLEAARHYERALELNPDNDDFRFFAEEARRLAP